MSHRSFHSYSYFKNLPLLVISAVTVYALIIFLVSISDAILSYAVPIYLVKTLKSPFLMGFVISVSALTGLVIDFITGSWFRIKQYLFFLFLAIVMAFLFPLSLIIFPPVVSFLIISMLFWGIFYNLIQYSHFNFIRTFMDKYHHIHAWGILSIASANAYLLGPLVAEKLIDINSKMPFVAGLFFLLLALIILFSYLKLFKQGKFINQNIPLQKINYLQGMIFWKKFFKVLWPLWIFLFMLKIIDASFWTIGTLLSEQLRHISPAGGLVLLMYILPSLFMGIFLAKIARLFGKKKAAYFAGIINGCLLSLIGFVHEINILLILIFFASLFSAIAIPEIAACFEDYVTRLKELGNELIGFNQSATSLAYIIGPIFSGIIASLVGYQITFSVLGLLLIIISIIALLVTPKKIHLPQQELDVIKQI